MQLFSLKLCYLEKELYLCDVFNKQHKAYNSFPD